MVTSLDPQKLSNLHTLELRGNQLESTLGINLPKLKNLFLVAQWASHRVVQESRHCPGGQHAWVLVGLPTNFIIIVITSPYLLLDVVEVGS
jgi:hypothetical protein